MIKLPETKEEILNFIDNVNLISPEGIAFRERVKTDENYRNIIKEIKKETYASTKNALNIIKNYVQSDPNMSEEVREMLVENQEMLKKYTKKN